jgi:cysteinyl-tRNA synthetase
MSQKYLGETLDIHGGGRDLIFPHHENEISQSEAATGKPFARYWIHNGFVNINKEKMSKSLGNMLTIKDIVKAWHPEVIRLFLVSQHYRSPVDFSEESLSEAKAGLDRFYATLHAIQEEMAKPAAPHTTKSPSPSILSEARQAVESFKAKVEEAMDDDFNTAQALGYFHELQAHLNSVLTLSKGRPTEEMIDLLKQGYEHFLKLGWIFGLFREDPKRYIDNQKQEGLKKLNLREEDILKRIDERNAARKEKNWKRADEVRNDLLAMGIVLEDTPSGTQWKLK